MNKHQRDSNRRTANRLRNDVRVAEYQKHCCENCGEYGAHWISTRGVSLQGLIDGVDDQEGFWTCPRLYGPDGRSIAP